MLLTQLFIYCHGTHGRFAGRRLRAALQLDEET
jgi:hypothetical protein